MHATNAAAKAETDLKPVKVTASGVCIQYDNERTGKSTLALSDLNLEIRSGEFICIVGPSGCGKTTFLGALDGLTPITSGEIRIDGVPVKGPGKDRAMVFQSASLLPWRTVLHNVAMGLEIQGAPKAERLARAEELLELVGLKSFAKHYPGELSGGMQQRVNLARALACDPQVLLLDEPFAALDAQTRELMQEELMRIWRQTKKTAVFITHQIGEAVLLADRVVVFSGRPGRVKEIVTIDIPRPRSLAEKRLARFHEYEDYIWALMEKEIRQATGGVG